MEDDSELHNFFKVWLSVFFCLTYCYFSSKLIPQGLIRLFSLLPIFPLFLYLPLSLSSLHLGGPTAFFISWLANFKLFLFAFNNGPLISSHQHDHPSISLPRFIALASLPIKINHKTSSLHSQPDDQTSRKLKDGHEPLQNYVIKALLLTMLIKVYDYRDYVSPKLIWLIFCLHVYFLLELILAMVAAVARAALGFELEPQFNKPYLSTSLQDFWGRRWNLMVTSILRPTIYQPTIRVATRVIGRKWAPLPAVMATFFVSGVMHELMFYYLGRERPTWEVTCFFVLQGFCVSAEIVLKKVVGDRWRIPAVLSGFLTVGFVLLTCFWLFLPPLFNSCKAGVRVVEEYVLFGTYLKNIIRGIRIL